MLKYVRRLGELSRNAYLRKGIWSRLDSLSTRFDAASYQAAWNEARAALQQAQALVKADCQKAQRYARLVKENGVSQQDADDAQSTCAQDKASVEAKKAGAGNCAH
ncbi:acriflavine resistance protein A precursor [Escherichia coli]|uniref:Acriflavine resistance protein A n=1 Tax=Escherichia coli TaxID=562 RepID=A0A485JFX7_ECOLX|nr:acriflavine resistance protein A precursor [Escherichia coli]